MELIYDEKENAPSYAKSITDGQKLDKHGSANRGENNKVVYTAYVAPRWTKSKSITYLPTDRPTDRRTDTRSYKVALSRLKTI